MKKVLKWIGIVLGALVGLIVVVVAVAYFMGSSRLNQTYTFPADNVAVSTDLARGEHLVKMLCVGCHGADLGGIVGWFPEGPLGVVDSTNLTSGSGGVGREYTTDEEYVLAVRHGVDPEGKPIFMPAVAGFQTMSDEDLGAVIAYLKTVPPVDRETNGHNFSALGKIMIGAGMLGDLPVEAVKHATRVTAPAAGVTQEYGQYLIAIGDCRACHGQQLAGGPFPDPSVTALVPNLTPGGELVAWQEADFITAMRTGVTPSKRALDLKLMPWKETAEASDDELKAMWLYLQSLPKTETQTK